MSVGPGGHSRPALLHTRLSAPYDDACAHPMTEDEATHRLGDGERAAIAEAEHDGEGWAMRGDLSPALRETLSSKGLIRLHMGRWQLTPAGFSCRPGF